MVSLDILKRFSGVFGPSSAEELIRAEIKDTLKEKCSFKTTPHGNLIAYNPKAKGDKTILFQAHMDELGFRPYRYYDDGFIELSAISPIPENASNQLLIFYPNEVFGILVIKRIDKEIHYFLDIGAKDAEEAKKMVPFFANGAYRGDFHETPNYLSGKSFDDRAGCALISHLLLDEPNNVNKIVGLFTVREESGNWPMPEVKTAFDKLDIKPDLVVNLEICPGGPTPLVANPMAIVGKGVTLTNMDRYYISNSDICQAMMEIADNEKIPYQQMSERSGGGELGSVCHTLGVQGYSFVIPGRYMHSPHSVISRYDYEAAMKLTAAAARSEKLLRGKF